MTQAELELILIRSVCEIQDQSGREKVEVTGDTCPLVDLKDFDSLNCVEATVDIFDQLQLELEFNNLFFEGEQPLTITQAVKRIFCSAPQVATM